MTKERDLLQRVVGWWDDDKGVIYNFVEEIRTYLAEPTQDEKAIAYWDTQNGKLIPAVPLSSERTCFKVPLVPLYLHPPHPFIRLTEEDLKNCWGEPDRLNTQALINFARAIEDALEEKNK